MSRLRPEMNRPVRVRSDDFDRFSFPLQRLVAEELRRAITHSGDQDILSTRSPLMNLQSKATEPGTIVLYALEIVSRMPRIHCYLVITSVSPASPASPVPQINEDN